MLDHMQVHFLHRPVSQCITRRTASKHSSATLHYRDWDAGSDSPNLGRCLNAFFLNDRAISEIKIEPSGLAYNH